MLRVTARSQYGLRALLYLARHADRERCRIKEIARDTGVPVNFLEQILVALRRGGLVRVYRGVQGGCALARRPDKITVEQILVALEGEFRLLERKERNDALARYWQGTATAIHEALRVTLQELATQDEAQARNLNYVI